MAEESGGKSEGRDDKTQITSILRDERQRIWDKIISDWDGFPEKYQFIEMSVSDLRKYFEL